MTRRARTIANRAGTALPGAVRTGFDRAPLPGRFFFKTECPDFETGVIQEEVTDDSAALPLWEGKVHGQVMSRD